MSLLCAFHVSSVPKLNSRVGQCAATCESRVLWQSSERFLLLPDEVECPHNALKKKWLSRSAVPLRRHLTGLGSQVREMGGLMSRDVLQIQYVNMCAGCSHALRTHACTRVRRIRQTRWIKPLPLFYETHAECWLHFAAIPFRFLRESLIFIQNCLYSWAN